MWMLSKRKAYQTGLAWGLQLREFVANTVETTEKSVAAAISDSPYSVHRETLELEVMALFEFASRLARESVASTVRGRLQERLWDGFGAGFKLTRIEIGHSMGRWREYQAGLARGSAAAQTIAEVGHSFDGVGEVFAKNIGFEGRASVSAIGVNVLAKAYTAYCQFIGKPHQPPQENAYLREGFR